MEKYFIVHEGSELYSDYFKWFKDKDKVAKAFRTMCEEFGIETKQFYLTKDRFHIVPTPNDNEKFRSMMMKSDYGVFKKNSSVAKRWVELVKDIENFKKPQLLFYLPLLGHRWKERLFNVNSVLYGSVESDGEVEIPGCMTEIKASEFYKVIEEMEE